MMLIDFYIEFFPAVWFTW